MAWIQIYSLLRSNSVSAMPSAHFLLFCAICNLLCSIYVLREGSYCMDILTEKGKWRRKTKVQVCLFPGNALTPLEGFECCYESWLLENWLLENWLSENWLLRKLAPRKLAPGKVGSQESWLPGKLAPTSHIFIICFIE